MFLICNCFSNQIYKINPHKNVRQNIHVYKKSNTFLKSCHQFIIAIIKKRYRQGSRNNIYITSIINDNLTFSRPPFISPSWNLLDNPYIPCPPCPLLTLPPSPHFSLSPTPSQIRIYTQPPKPFPNTHTSTHSWKHIQQHWSDTCDPRRIAITPSKRSIMNGWRNRAWLKMSRFNKREIE